LNDWRRNHEEDPWVGQEVEVLGTHLGNVFKVEGDHAVVEITGTVGVLRDAPTFLESL
jgi:hypothetical protein